MGKLLKETGIFTLETAEKAMQKCIPARKANLLDANIKAIKLGFNY
ncbi:MAG: hypothetical protein RR540_01255 [Oscillospiraceae bacterium]